MPVQRSPLPMRPRVEVDPVILVYALRYALGRSSYAVGEVADAVAVRAGALPTNLLASAYADVGEHLAGKYAILPPEPADITATWRQLHTRLGEEIGRRG